VARVRAEGPGELLAPFEVTGPGIPRQGNPVLVGDSLVGFVSSGTHSPSLGHGIGMAYLSPDLAEPGTRIEIDVRGKRRAALTTSKPIYKR
jgi:aminomethyltransferase